MGLLLLLAFAAPAWGQATDPLADGDPTANVPSDPIDPPADAAPPSTQEYSDVLGSEDTTGGTYLVFRTRRHWRAFAVRSRLLRNLHRIRPAGETVTTVTAAGGDPDAFLSAGLPSDSLRVSPAGTTLQDAGWTLWTSFEISRLKDVRTAFRKRGHAVSATAGLERSVNERLAAGISVSYTHSRESTLFNGGHSRIDGLTVTPYISITPVEWLNVTVTGGYVHNRERLSWLSAGTLTSGRRHSSGYTFAAVAEAGRWFSNVFLAGRTGIAASGDRWRGFVDSLGTPQPAMRESLVQWSAEAGAALWLDPVMPYLNVTYTRDLKKPSQETDRDDFTLAGGLSWYGSGAYRNVSADLSGTVVLGRRSQRNYTLSLGLRISF